MNREAPKYVYSSDGKLRGKFRGYTSRPCIEGCSGARMNIRWSDGTTTYPCSAGTKVRKDGNWQII